jgi:predicted GH43/DUF377 family glycosyl hydrolase
MIDMHKEIFRRFPDNPILTSEDMPYICNTVFNPGAVMMEYCTLLLLRVEDTEGRSHLTVARSANGVSNWQIEAQPLLAPGRDHNPFEEYGCEDPRITYLDDLKTYVIAYTAYSPMGAGVALALTTDFQTVERLGLILAPSNKDAAVFPRKIRDKYWMLHRPASGSIEHIWLNESTDLVHWGKPWMIIGERGGPWWDGVRVGANGVPIETKDGWLILYHGVKEFPAGPKYRMGAALLDLEDPCRLIARLPYWIFGPKDPYEVTGDVPNIVFSCGHTIVGDEIRLYYGAADTCVCLATASIQDILDVLKQHHV